MPVDRKHWAGLIRMTFVLSNVLFEVSSGPAIAQEFIPKEEYAACMNTARRLPEAGFERALTWAGLGGGAAAKHCASVALMELGQYAESARRLQQLANEVTASAQIKAELLGQSGQAWLLAEQPMRADAALTAALAFSPKNVELLIDRAQVLAEQDAYWDAIIDLSHALDIDDNRTDALVFRASAYRRLLQLNDAKRDLWRALVISPDNPLALLERGMIARLQGQDSEARRDWLRVIEVARESRAAELARLNLQKMDGP